MHINAHRPNGAMPRLSKIPFIPDSPARPRRQSEPIAPAIQFGGCPLRKQVGIYLRVSTDGQTTENQGRELEAVAARSGWEVVDLYEDASISGSNGREKRPGPPIRWFSRQPGGTDRQSEDRQGARPHFPAVAAWPRRMR